jgi:hypothetical protein
VEQKAPHPPAPSPEGEGEQFEAKFKVYFFKSGSFCLEEVYPGGIFLL